MRTRLLLAVATIAACIAGVPAAHAARFRSGCPYASVASPGGTGGYDGAVHGYATFDDTATHTLRCVFRDYDGNEVAASPLTTGTGLLLTAGPVHLVTGDLLVCPEVDGYWDCYSWEEVLPPQVVFDRLADVLALLTDAEAAYVDPVACPALAALAPGVPGVVDITPDGDTTLAGAGPFWDCPPYGDLFPPA